MQGFKPIKNDHPILKMECIGLEPTKTRMNKTKTEAFASVRTRWLRVWDEVGTYLSLSNNASIP